MATMHELTSNSPVNSSPGAFQVIAAPKIETIYMSDVMNFQVFPKVFSENISEQLPIYVRKRVFMKLSYSCIDNQLI